MLTSDWHNTDMVQAWYWHDTDTKLTWYSHGTGTILTWYWHDTDMRLTWYWHGASTILTWYCHPSFFSFFFSLHSSVFLPLLYFPSSLCNLIIQKTNSAAATVSLLFLCGSRRLGGKGFDTSVFAGETTAISQQFLISTRGGLEARDQIKDRWSLAIISWNASNMSRWNGGDSSTLGWHHCRLSFFPSGETGDNLRGKKISTDTDELKVRE